MNTKTHRKESDYRGFKFLVKANAASTVEGAWHPSYQIRDEAVNTAILHPNPVNGSADAEWVLEEAVRMAKIHIDSFLSK